jgi:hypothetical protein
MYKMAMCGNDSTTVLDAFGYAQTYYLDERGWHIWDGRYELHVDLLQGELLIDALLVKILRKEARGAEAVVVDEGALSAGGEHSCVRVGNHCGLRGEVRARKAEGKRSYLAPLETRHNLIRPELSSN